MIISHHPNLTPAPGVRAAWYDRMGALYAASRIARDAYCANRTDATAAALTAAERAVHEHIRCNPSDYPVAFAKWAADQTA